MTRARGRAPRGERVEGAVPNGHWSTLTMIGALRLDGLAAAATVDAATDGPIFRSFVTDALVPALRHGDVVVWDGLTPHKAAGVAEAVESAGARLLPLPPYSPDFSPIEPMWSKVKQDLRSAEARTPEALGRRQRVHSRQSPPQTPAAGSANAATVYTDLKNALGGALLPLPGTPGRGSG